MGCIQNKDPVCVCENCKRLSSSGGFLDHNTNREAYHLEVLIDVYELPEHVNFHRPYALTFLSPRCTLMTFLAVSPQCHHADEYSILRQMHITVSTKF